MEAAGAVETALADPTEEMERVAVDLKKKEGGRRQGGGEP